MYHQHRPDLSSARFDLDVPLGERKNTILHAYQRYINAKQQLDAFMSNIESNLITGKHQEFRELDHLVKNKYDKFRVAVEEYYTHLYTLEYRDAKRRPSSGLRGSDS